MAGRELTPASPAVADHHKIQDRVAEPFEALEGDDGVEFAGVGLK